MTASTTRRTRTTSVKVALLDDHALVLDGLAARLNQRSSGVTVVAAVSAWGDLLDAEGFPFDVVVVDLHLDDSIPIGTKVRALRAAGTSTVVMSRHADSGSINAALTAGALAFVPKTEGASELITAIRAAAQQERHLPAHLVEAVTDFTATPDPGLGRQEQRALVLYAGGRSIKEVAAQMETTEETVKSYIKRGRRKHRAVGVDLGTRVLLRRHAVREGWIAPE